MEIRPEKNKKIPKYAAALAAVCVTAGSATGCTDPSQVKDELKALFGFSSDSESYVEIDGEIAIEGDFAVDSSFEENVSVPSETELATVGIASVPEISEPILAEGVAPMPEETMVHIEGGVPMPEDTEVFLEGDVPMPIDGECDGADDCRSPIHEG